MSFFHGSNDGQKGMGLIMLILIGVAPTAYALNRAVPESHTPAFVASAQAAAKVVSAHAAGFNTTGDPRPAVTGYVHAHKDADAAYPALARADRRHRRRRAEYGALDKTPTDKVQNVRNDMYLISEAIRVLARTRSPN